MANYVAIKNMEDFATMMLKLPEEAQNEFFKTLEGQLGTEDVETLKKCVTVYKLMTNERYYKAVQDAVGETIYNHFNRA